MRVNRTLLYAGIFLVAIGGVVVAADLGAVDTALLADALRLWPLAIIGLGLGLVFRRSQLGLPAGMLAAAMPGLLIGGAFAIVPRFAGDCGAREPAAIVASESGTFEGPATVRVTGGCGSLSIGTADGDGWQLEAGNTAGRAPVVTASGSGLRIDAVGDDGWDALSRGRDDWDLTLPTSPLRSLELDVNAGRADVSLRDAQIDRLSLAANLADVVVDASEAAVAAVFADVNLGKLAIVLPAGADSRATFEAGAGELRVCVPEGLGVRVEVRGDAETVEVNGLDPDRPRFRLTDGATWVSSDYGTADHRTDVLITADFATVEINPIGGCR